MIRQCNQCGTRVIPTQEGKCPACRHEMQANGENNQQEAFQTPVGSRTPGANRFIANRINFISYRLRGSLSTVGFCMLGSLLLGVGMVFSLAVSDPFTASAFAIAKLVVSCTCAVATFRLGLVMASVIRLPLHELADERFQPAFGVKNARARKSVAILTLPLFFLWSATLFGSLASALSHLFSV